MKAPDGRSRVPLDDAALGALLRELPVRPAPPALAIDVLAEVARREEGAARLAATLRALPPRRAPEGLVPAVMAEVARREARIASGAEAGGRWVAVVLGGGVLAALVAGSGPLARLAVASLPADGVASPAGGGWLGALGSAFTATARALEAGAAVVPLTWWICLGVVLGGAVLSVAGGGLLLQRLAVPRGGRS